MRCSIWVSGPTYLVWRSSPQLSGVVLWGRPEPRHAASLARLFMKDADCERQLSLIDLCRVHGIDPGTFDLLAEYVSLHAEVLGRRIAALALVRPAGFIGAVVAGFYQVVKHVHPVEVFTKPCDGLKWLGAGDPSSLVTEIDGALDTCASTSSVLHELRAHLRRQLGNASLATAAAALGLSGRALQRRLRDATTSFQLEQNAAQIYVAKRLLRETGHDIKRIAFEVGCSSAAAFSVLFRKLVGQSPSGWRRLGSRSEIERLRFPMTAPELIFPSTIGAPACMNRDDSLTASPTVVSTGA